MRASGGTKSRGHGAGDLLRVAAQGISDGVESYGGSRKERPNHHIVGLVNQLDRNCNEEGIDAIGPDLAKDFPSRLCQLDSQLWVYPPRKVQQHGIADYSREKFTECDGENRSEEHTSELQSRQYLV